MSEGQAQGQGKERLHGGAGAANNGRTEASACERTILSLEQVLVVSSVVRFGSAQDGRARQLLYTEEMIQSVVECRKPSTKASHLVHLVCCLAEADVRITRKSWWRSGGGIRNGQAEYEMCDSASMKFFDLAQVLQGANESQSTMQWSIATASKKPT